MTPSIIFLALLLGGILLVPPAGAGIQEAKRVFPENDTEGYLPVDVLSIDPVIKNATPDYQFLILSPEGKENRLHDLDAAFDFLYPGDPQKDARKAGLKQDMQDIWDKYPVVFETTPGGPGYPTYGGSIVTARFAPALQNIRLTGDENEVIRKSSAIMNEAYLQKQPPGSPYASTSSPDSPGISPTRQPVPLSPLLACAAFGCAGCIGVMRKKMWEK
ncbi:MAG: hypothetical protein WC391_05845 [Methanoregula sp.]|jgi:hypothetical protein